MVAMLVEVEVMVVEVMVVVVVRWCAPPALLPAMATLSHCPVRSSVRTGEQLVIPAE